MQYLGRFTGFLIKYAVKKSASGDIYLIAWYPVSKRCHNCGKICSMQSVKNRYKEYISAHSSWGTEWCANHGTWFEGYTEEEYVNIINQDILLFMRFSIAHFVCDDTLAWESGWWDLHNYRSNHYIYFTHAFPLRMWCCQFHLYFRKIDEWWTIPNLGDKHLQDLKFDTLGQPPATASAVELYSKFCEWKM